jgi:protoporphyrin/coproporphyrin ferrochelatase
VNAGLAPYDAVLLLSFGGPEGPPDVLPFLENVTRGRGIPRERLEEVAEHYLARGGRSPINEQNRALREALADELGRRGIGVPVYWGNRNWRPYLLDALRQAASEGAARIAVVVTSAFASYSGCRQYREDLAAALDGLGDAGRDLRLDKVRLYFNHPGFLEPTAEALRDALAGLPPEQRAGAVVAFVTHSVPEAMNEASGPGGGAYLAQHLDACRAVMDRLAAGGGTDGVPPPAWDLVFCSRSGPPTQPWLEPDVEKHLATVSAGGATAAVVVPIGFVSDHMEVVHDLDADAGAVARGLGLPFVRVPTPGTDPRFVAGLADLLVERASTERGEQPARPALGLLGASHDVCPAGCCLNLRAPDTPAACGADVLGALR